MRKLVISLLCCAATFFMLCIPKLHAAYQSATGVLASFPGVIDTTNDGSGFMKPPFPRNTGAVAKKGGDGGTYVTLYTTTAPTNCSLVKKVKGSVTLQSTENTPSEIGVLFGAIDITTKNIVLGKFTQAPNFRTALPNGPASYGFQNIKETATFEYEFDESIPYRNVVTFLALDDADDYSVINTTRDDTLMLPDRELSYTIKNIEFDIDPVACPTIKRKKVVGYYLDRKQPQEKKCPIFTQHMKEGDKDGVVGKSKQYDGVSQVISEVKLLQKTLKDQGYFTGEPNGVFGPQTKAAVKAYQAIKFKNVITPWQISKPTGWAYQATIRQLNTDLGCYQTVTLDNGVVLK